MTHLPVAHTRRAEPAGRPAAPDAADTVLVVDDAPEHLALLQDALDESGYQVILAGSGDEALERATRDRPDIVLLDGMAPGLDGLALARRLKADPATAAIPIVFMTAQGETEQVVQAFGAGVVDCIAKPVRTGELIARIENHLRSARAQGQARRALDAFGHATLVVRERDGRRLWQTALARELLLRHFPLVPDVLTPPAVMAWVAREAVRRRAGAPAHGLTTGQGAQRLTLALHAMDDSGGAEGEWLVVLREDSEAALLDGLARAFRTLTPREVEVLYWVVRGKTNRDIGDILSLSPRTVHKHLEHVFEKLGVANRTAATALAMAKAR